MGYPEAGKVFDPRLRLDSVSHRVVLTGIASIVSKPQPDQNPLRVPSPALRLPGGGVPTASVPTLSSWFVDEVQPHESSLRSYLRGLFPSLPDIDDLVQESYARLIRAKEAGRVTYAKAFLFTTARNAALDFFRRRKVVAIDSVADLASLSVIEDQPDASEAVNKQQELALLAEAVRGLPERCRQVLTLRLLYGMPHREIAAELRISEHTVKAQLAKGMRRCADFLAERGLPQNRRHSSHS
jgi:RNA polymerase sigma-70 factor (ECF subfamily)